MEEKKKGVQRFFKLSAGRHKREAAPGTPAQAVKGRKGRKKWVKPLVILLIIGAAAAAAMTFRGMKAKAATAQAQSHNTASAERRDISSELSSSGTLKAKDTYSITSMVEGEVLSAGFEEGDQVEKDQVLYEIDKSSMESQLTSSVNSLSRSQSSYEDALEDYNDALGDYSGNTYKATDTGYIKELYISAGDKVSGNTKLADVYSDDVMEIRIPFLSGEAAMIGAGMPAAVTLTDTGEQVAGTVKAVANQETVLTGGRLVRVVTIQVQNPGGLTTSLRATAQIGEFIGSEDGAFEASVDTTMNADLSTSVEVESLLVNVGDYVTKGTPVFKMTDKSADKLIQSYKDALDKAEESVESAQNKLDSTQDSYDNYTIKAPISGQVITKNFKVGQRKAHRTHGAHGRGADGSGAAQQDVKALGRFPGPQISGIYPLFFRPALARYGMPDYITDFTFPVFRPGTVQGLLVGIQYQQCITGRIKTVQQVVKIFPGKVQHHIPGPGPVGALQ